MDEKLAEIKWSKMKQNPIRLMQEFLYIHEPHCYLFSVLFDDDGDDAMKHAILSVLCYLFPSLLFFFLTTQIFKCTKDFPFALLGTAQQLLFIPFVRGMLPWLLLFPLIRNAWVGEGEKRDNAFILQTPELSLFISYLSLSLKPADTLTHDTT